MHPIIRHPFRFLACLACLVMGNACIAIGEILDEGDRRSAWEKVREMILDVRHGLVYIGWLKS